MKFELLRFVLLGMTLLPAVTAEARCNPFDEFESHGCPVPREPNLNFAILKVEMFGKTYCEIGSKNGAGLSISTDGAVVYFANNIGAPDPTRYFHVIASYSGPFDQEAPFSIGAFAKTDHQPIGNESQYVYHRRTDLIVSGDFQFSPKACP